MNRTLTALAAAAAAAVVLPAPAQANPIAAITPLWTFNHNVAPTIGRSSEIPAFDAASRTLWVVGGNGLDVLNLAGTRLQTFETTAFGGINSISLAGGIAAVSFSDASVTAPGRVEFFNMATFLASGGAAAHLGGVTVGAVPDMVTWAAGGTQLLVANEGERQNNAANPAGSISIVDFNPAAPASSGVTTLGFTAFDGQEAALRTAGIRIQPGVAASIALEPEYIAIAPGGARAMVTLQENNALAELNLQTRQITRLIPLGAKDHGLADNGFRLNGAPLSNAIDPSDQDGPGGANLINLRNVPVKGLYQPDTIMSYARGGNTFYVMASEGDAFVDDADIIRLGNAAAVLDPVLFPNAATLKQNANLGRLNVFREGSTGSGAVGNMTEIVAMGARSFTIVDANGAIVFDSGNSLELQAIARGIYADGRSDDKGVEPEGVALAEINGRTLAFIGLERTTRSAIAIYDVTDPADVSFLDMVVSTDATVLRPEGLQVFESDGLFYLAAAHESTADSIVAGGTSNRTVLYQLTPVPEPGTYALMLAGLLAVAAAAKRRRR